MSETVFVDGDISLDIPVDGTLGVYMDTGGNMLPQVGSASATSSDVTYTPDSGYNCCSAFTVEGITGTQTITANGSYDVLDDSTVTVNVEGGGITPSGTKAISITANGTTTEDVTDYADVEVTVNVTPTLQSKSTTANGTITADNGYDGLSQVTVAIPEYSGSYSVTPSSSAQTLSTSGKVMTGDVTVAAGSTSTLISKTITANGTYTASDDSADGYSDVTVNVSGSGVATATGSFTLSSAQLMPTITHNLDSVKIAAIIYPSGTITPTAGYQIFYAAYINVPGIIDNTTWTLDFTSYNSKFSGATTVDLTSSDANYLKTIAMQESPWSTQSEWHTANNRSRMNSQATITSNTIQLYSNISWAPGTYSYIIYKLE